MDKIVEKIVSEVSNFFNENLKNEDLELYDIIFRREKKGWVLRVYIDGEKVGLDECVFVSKTLSKWLDEVDIIPYSNYYLEVSTPGANREIRNIDEFRKYIGKYCKIKLTTHDSNNRLNYKGYIEDVKDGKITIYVEEENKYFEINYDDIKKANLELKF